MRRNTPENRCGPVKPQPNAGTSAAGRGARYACRPAVMGRRAGLRKMAGESSQISVVAPSVPQVGLKFPGKTGEKLPLVYTNDPMLRREFGLSGLTCNVAIEGPRCRRAAGRKWSELQGERPPEAVDNR